MWRVYIRNHPTVGPWFARVEGNPGWVWKAAMMAAFLTVAIPLMALAMAAIVIGIVVFIVLGVVATVIAAVQGLFAPRHASLDPADAPRVNVRVIRDE